MRSYPEWFIGGPWHGRDKMKDCPDLQTMVRVAIPPRITLAEILEPQSASAEFTTYTYVPRRASIFGENLTVWVGEGIAPELAHESETSLLLGQLIMAPHRKDLGRTPFDVSPFAQHHRNRSEIEREVIARIHRQYQQRLADLQDQLQASTVRNTQIALSARQTSALELDPDRDAAARMELRLKDGTYIDYAFTDITVYEDPGSEGESPAWIATAQSLGDHSVTGYGETPLSAVYAMLGDTIGVYARVTELTNRLR